MPQPVQTVQKVCHCNKNTPHVKEKWLFGAETGTRGVNLSFIYFWFVFFSHVYLVLLMTCLFMKTFLLLLSQIRQQPPLFPEKRQRSCWEVGFSTAKGCKNSRNQWPGSGFMPSSRYVEDRARRLLSAHKELNYINKHASIVLTETEVK